MGELYSIIQRRTWPACIQSVSRNHTISTLFLKHMITVGLNLVPSVSHLTALAPGDGKMRDPGNEVVLAFKRSNEG